MNKNKDIKNNIHIKMVNQNIEKIVDGDVKTQNDKLNLLLKEHYARQKASDRLLIVCHCIPKLLRKKPEGRYEYEFCDCKNEFEKLIKKHWEDIICGVLLETEDKLNQDYFISDNEKDIPEGMCALKPEYEAYQNYKNEKPVDNYRFIDNGDTVYIVDGVDLNENDQDEDIEDIGKRRPLYRRIEDEKSDIQIDVRREKVKYLWKLQEKGDDKKYVLYPETLVLFLKTLCRDSIDCTEKRKMFLEFLQSDKLKIQDFNSEVIKEVIDLIEFGRYTNINEWFGFLELNKECNLSPSVLFKCVLKAQKSGDLFQEMYYYSDEYIERLDQFVTKYINGLDEQNKEWWIENYDLINNGNVYRPKPSQSGKYDHESYYHELNDKFNRWKPEDITKVLSFVSNYTWPNQETSRENYDKEIDCFFGLLVCLLDNLAPGKKIAIQLAKEIFDFVNKNMPDVKMSIDKIGEYKKGKKLLGALKKNFVNIAQNSYGNRDFEIEVDYSALFNDFVRDRFNNDENIKYNSLDELSRARENLIAEFVEHGKKIGIDISDDAAKTLFLDTSFVSRVLYSDCTKEDIVKTPEDFKRYVDIISKMKSINEPLLLKDFWRISSPIAKNTVPVDDMLKFMSENVETKFNMSFSCLYYYVYSKIKQDTKWTYENIIKLLSYSSDFSKEDRNFKYDLESHFLDLLRYVFENVDENVDMDFWQNVFNWINENMPHVYFSDRLLTEHGCCLESVCEWCGISLCTDGYGKIKVEHDYSYVEEKFDFFVWSYFRVTAKCCTGWGADARDYEKLKTEKFKSLDDIKSACNLLLDQFFKKYSRNITANCVKTELRNKLQLRLYNQYAMQDFIRSIEPGIIKSSNDLRDFIDYVNSINLNKVSAFTDNIEYAADFVSNNSLSVDEAKSFLSCLTRKYQLWPSVLVKHCQKIKKDTHWSLNQIREFLSYLDSGFQAEDKEVQSESLFGLLNVFCEKANIEWLSNEYDISQADVVSYIFSLLSQKLHREEFKDLFGRANAFENGKILQKNLNEMRINLVNIDFSRRVPVILTEEAKIEREKQEKGNDKNNNIEINNLINNKEKENQEKKLKEKQEKEAQQLKEEKKKRQEEKKQGKEETKEEKKGEKNEINEKEADEKKKELENQKNKGKETTTTNNLINNNPQNNNNLTINNKENDKNNNNNNKLNNKTSLTDDQPQNTDISLSNMVNASKDFADFCNKLNKKNVAFNQINFGGEPLGFGDLFMALLYVIFHFSSCRTMVINFGFWNLVRLKAAYENARSKSNELSNLQSQNPEEQSKTNIKYLSESLKNAQKKAKKNQPHDKDGKNNKDQNQID